jgi:hypothetical protein
MEWYYEIDGQPKGPVGIDEFLERVREGVIGEETLVWRKGMIDWLEYGAVSDAPRVVTPPRLPEVASVVPPLGVAEEVVVEVEGDGPAWERDAGHHNVFARLGTTCAEVMMDTTRCFRSLRQRGNLGMAVSYALFAQVIGLVFFSADLWLGIRNRGLEVVLKEVLPRQVEVEMVQRFISEKMTSPAITVLLVGVFVVVNLLLIPVQSVVLSGILHLNLRMTGAARRPFETTFRLVSYVNGSVTIIGVISSLTSMMAMALGRSMGLAGALIGVGGFMWMLFVLVTALSETHRISGVRALGALSLIVIEFVILAVGLAVLLPAVMALMAAAK